MEATITELSALCAQRFGSFSEAARATLTFLEDQLPPGRLLLAELSYSDDEYKVLDARGPGCEPLARGARLPLRGSFCAHMAEDAAPALTGNASKDPVYAGLELRRLVAAESYAGAALELSDGTRVASVCAVSPETGRYGDADLALLTVAARLLAHEWERVTREAKLRQLLRQSASPVTADPVTGLALRAAFVEHLEREWHASERRITESYVVVVRLEGVDAVRMRGGRSLSDLVLKNTAEVLTAVSRRSDIVGRVGDDRFGAVLIGCKGTEGAEAYCSRLRSSFERAISHRSERVSLRCRVEPLAGSPSGAEALKRAEERLAEDEAAPAAAAGL